jgi:Putative GTPase activating protein for Arf
MVSSENKNQVFNNLKSNPENNKCMECGVDNPTFTSVNNGCLICINCVQTHGALGREISRIKPLDDTWSLEDLRLMAAGGNSALQEFFAYYNLLNTPPNFKYNTRAAHFYRDMLSVVAEDREYRNTCPSIEEGVEIVAASYPDLHNVRSEEIKVDVNPTAPEANPNPNQGKGIWTWAKNTYAKGVKVGNKTVDKIGDHLNKFSEKPAVKKIENTTMHYAGKLEAGLKTLVDKIQNKPAVQSAVFQANNAANSFAREVKYTYNTINSNPSVQKLKTDTMNIIRDIGNSIKGIHN